MTQTRFFTQFKPDFVRGDLPSSLPHFNWFHRRIFTIYITFWIYRRLRKHEFSPECSYPTNNIEGLCKRYYLDTSWKKRNRMEKNTWYSSRMLRKKYFRKKPKPDIYIR